MLTARALTQGGPLDLINGIPVHPLVVHAAVVLVPAAALGVVVMAVWPRFSRQFGVAVVGLATLATAACVVAKEAGEALEERVGEPGFDHAELGDVMPLLAVGLVVASGGLWLLDRRRPTEGPDPRRVLRIVAGGLAVLVAGVNVVWIYRVGDSGAKSVWTPRVAPAATGSGPDSTDGPDGPDGPDSTAYTMAEVASHDSADDCWAVIGTVVYDLTEWVGEHPGGTQAIVGLCGADGSAAFDGQHGDEDGPAAQLQRFAIGELR